MPDASWETLSNDNGLSSALDEYSKSSLLPGTDPNDDCVPCGVGKFKSGYGNSECIGCSVPFTTTVGGADTEDDCVCDAGHYRDGAGQCPACPLGTYKPTAANAIACNSCKSTETTAAMGALTESECVCRPGFERVAGVCEPCGKGTYKDTAGDGACSLCPGGTSSNTVGGADVASCDTCKPGFFGDDCSGVCSCSVDQVCLDGRFGSGNCTCFVGSGLSGAGCDQCEAPQYFGRPWCNSTVECVNGVPDYGFDGSGKCRSCQLAAYDFAADPTCATCAALNFGVSCLQCPIGHHGSGDNTDGPCELCSAGTFKDVTTALQRCKPCDAGTVRGKLSAMWPRTSDRKRWGDDGCGMHPTAKPIPNSGFYPLPGQGVTSGLYEPCTPAGVCLRGGVCRFGHIGERCSQCIKGWAKNPSSGLCEKCPSSIPFIFMGLAVLGIILCILLIKLARKNTAFFTAASVGFNFLQLIAVLASFQIKWPGWTQRFFEILSAANIDLQLFKPECLVSSSSDAYFTIWATKLAAPWALLVMFAVGFSIFRLYAAARKWTAPAKASMKYAFTNASVMAMFVMYLLVTNTALEIYPCTKQADGKYTMNREPSIRCYQGKWFELLVGSICAMIMFSLLMPLGVLKVLHKRRFNLWKRKNLARYGLLYLRYRPKYYFFEILVLVRKFGVVFGKVASSASVVGQVLTALAVVCLSLGLQLKTHPFATMRINRLETLMLSCAGFVLALAFVYAAADGGLNASFANTLGVVLVGVVCVAIVILLVAIVLEITKIHRMLRRGLVGKYVVDRLDVWRPFYTSGMFLLEHTQTTVGEAAANIVMTFSTTEPVELVAEMFLETVITHRSEKRTTDDVVLHGCLQPSDQAVESRSDFLQHTVTMHAPAPGHYVATIAVMAAGRTATTPREPATGMRGWLEKLAAFVDGSVTDQAHSPQMVRAMMVNGAERAIRFRVTASPEWAAEDAMAGTAAAASEFATDVDEDALLSRPWSMSPEEMDALDEEHELQAL
ncbi:uncharacterized protein AMSG_10693 [Thecamonas trahens ATCC 50062]|uniref:EGF-like domain-containing protein n=1 Tax=Thecamonas trahens ATCC 50062 TaxID=461836 RepID=A0A0L0DS53_THETB|nr:hypothetical protein AMSG_10693 [Thecamonas trahens ATCC 50062]KNC55095.1 hypothetical protein AMSG_10693 [Thecamonas trahens ATCC 50062]|eukprot:XP_013753279.1 hypothetical protein AMSG_10693 [Thecamonas trahens ATCC 50062]